MFVFNRSLFAVLAPLVLLAAVVFFSNRETGSPRPDVAAPRIADAAHPKETGERDAQPNRQTVAANLPSR